MKIGVIADDLTGANATGVRLARQGFEAATMVHYNNLPTSDAYNAVCIDTDSRYAREEVAQIRVKTVLENLTKWGAHVICKRIDSTVRGNIGVELDTVLTELGEKAIAVVVASYPESGRFISEDTYKGQVDNPLSLNRYTYVENNPLSFIDPTGHWSTEVTANWSINEAKWKWAEATSNSDRAYWAGRAEQIRDQLRQNGTAEANIMQSTDYMIPEDVVNQIAWDATIKKIESNPYGFGLFVHSANAIQYAPLGGLAAGSLKIVKTATSVIKNDKRLVRAAMEMGKDPRVQSEADNLVKSFLSGNTNPGKGSKSLGFGGIYEMRGANGARVYFKNVESGIEIVGKSNKANQADVIKVLRDLYGK